MKKFNLRGRILPVINLLASFNLLPSEKPDRKALIVETDRMIFGVLVDDVTEVTRIQAASIEAVPAAAARDLIRGIGKHNGGLIILPNIDPLLEAGERNVLACAV